MAPSRRKGASKAAAVAAACRKWKVGDLVLAKVKGFPAWPATVSEPEKWGYSADWKKVLVFFFGTQQIAFCNPADVEAFTEEKKESILNKRHGKGADFLRAAREIIDSYELKKQEQANDMIGQTGSTNGVKSEDHVSRNASLASKDEAVTPPVDLCSNISKSLETNNEVATLLVQEDKLASEWHNGNLEVKKASLPTTYSRKKYSGTQVVSTRRSRSLVREGVQNDVITLNLSRDGLQKRSKRARRSPGSSDGLGSNASPEENGSEIVTVDSDTKNLNDVLKDEYDVRLSQTLEFRNKAVINKKKRKPSRKREFRDKLEKTDKIERVQSSDIESTIEKPSKEDGDEHLPLVKRARVRMGQTVEPLNKQRPDFVSLSDAEVTVQEELDPCFTLHKCRVNKPPLLEANNNNNNNIYINNNKHFGFVDDEAALPPSKRLHRALEAMSANAAENKQGSPGGPSTMKTIINGNLESKEADDSSNNLSSPVEQNETVDEIGVSSQPSRSIGLVKVVDGEDSEMVDSSTEAVETVTCPESPKPLSDDVEKKASSPESKKNPCDVSGYGLSSDPVSLDDGKNSVVPDSFIETVETVEHSENPKASSDDVMSTELKKDSSVVPGVSSNLENGVVSHNDDKDSVIETVLGPESLKALSDDVEKKKLFELEKDPSDVSGSGVSSDPVSSNLENGVLSHANVMLQSSPPKSCDIVDCPIQNYANDNAIAEDAEGTEKLVVEVDNSPSLTTVKELTVDPGPDLFSTYIVENNISHKSVSGTWTPSLLTDPLDSAGVSRDLPPNNTSICHTISSSSNSSLLENSGGSSPNVNEKTKHTDSKWSTVSEANAALTSFEASIGTLTRTKKSIDRATRIAIDCAKFGISVKVVETIARSLESESSLHKRVDLFFLVDSIAQCSRGLRGDVGGLYPSAIQAVLPRLLLAAAPPGSSALENRRQCLKVLKLWQERKILPEPMIRHHIRELDSLNNMSSRISNSRRPFRNERAFDDPVREVEGMLVDEYGSNSSIQLSGLCMPTISMLKDEKEESDSDVEGFEAVTPERDPEVHDKVPTPAAEKHTHVLEDVDGELEMEDLAPTREGETTVTAQAHHQHLPPLPNDLPPSSPPLPNSPPPHASFPPPPPPLPPVSVTPPPSTSLPAPLPLGNFPDAKLYVASQNGSDDRYHPSEVPESSNACSFGVPRPAASNVHLRPPHPAPSSQFSYFQSDPPPSFPGRFHFVNSTDTGNFHSDHDRMHMPPQDDTWRFHPPPFSGPCHPDGRYPPNMYPGPPCEPSMSNNNWHYPANHRDIAPHRPYPEAANRGHNFWRPR